MIIFYGWGPPLCYFDYRLIYNNVFKQTKDSSHYNRNLSLDPKMLDEGAELMFLYTLYSDYQKNVE